jgi:hypothetical protein
VNNVDRKAVAELLLEGAPLDRAEGFLRAAGLKEKEALAEIEDILCSPIFQAARPKVQLGQRLALAAELHQRVTQQNGGVPRLSGFSAEQFYDGWLAHHQPVVLEGFAQDWPALEWTPELLAERLGDQPIEVLIGRDQAAHPDRDFRSLKKQVSPQHWAQLLRQTDQSNDLYLVARNSLMQGPSGAAILSDTPIGEAWVDTASLGSCCSLWMGPKGTFTALHHDTCHALFVQLVGRKRFRLASPLIPDLLEAIEPYYHRHRALDTVCPSEHILEAEIGPGDALFLPVGWWHEARSLSLSIGMSFNGLHAANDYQYYCPGRV